MRVRMSDDFKVAYKRLKKRHCSSLMEHVRFGWLSRPKDVAEAVALE